MHTAGNGHPSAYLGLLEKALTASLYPESGWQVVTGHGWRRRLVSALRRRGLLLVRDRPFDAARRERGEDHPCFGFTMVGHKRLDNIRECVETILAEGVPGDLLEAGVWRGGSAIYMKGILHHHGETGRAVWLADSFEGLPKPSHESDHDSWDLSGAGYFAVSEEEVRANFERFGLLDGNVRFLKGWFRDTLPTAPVERLSLLRLDGDLYESTMDTLDALYPRVSTGGFVIVDDYGWWPACRRAVDEYRDRHGITSELKWADGTGVYWRVN